MNPTCPPLLALAALLSLAQCHTSDPDPATPESQLPEATQTGAGTFGCLLNGQPWLPVSDFHGLTSPYRVEYDPTYAGGSLAIKVYHKADGLAEEQYLLLGGAPINKTGSYIISNSGSSGVYFTTGRTSGPCQEYGIFNNAPGFSMSGQLVVTRLDLGAGILSGTFAFTLAQTGCDTLKFTQGRFDKKL